MSVQTQQDSTEGILLQVAQGLEHAMERCITNYGNLVWSITLRYLKDRSAAEDLVQEIFTELWKKADRYNPAIASESTFIGMLARRRAIDYVRKENRRPQLESLEENESISHATVESTSVVRCENEDVKNALKILPEQTQQIFSLHFDQGMTHSEIVEKIGLPLGTVKTRLRRGLIEIRDHLRRIEGAEPNFPATS